MAENTTMQLKRRPTAATPEIKADRRRKARLQHQARARSKASRDSFDTAERQRLLRLLYGSQPELPPTRSSPSNDQGRENTAGPAAVR